MTAVIAFSEDGYNRTNGNRKIGVKTAGYFQTGYV